MCIDSHLALVGLSETESRNSERVLMTMVVGSDGGEVIDVFAAFIQVRATSKQFR